MVDADDAQTCLGQPAGDLLTPGSHPHHDRVNLLDHCLSSVLDPA